MIVLYAAAWIVGEFMMAFLDKEDRDHDEDEHDENEEDEEDRLEKVVDLVDVMLQPATTALPGTRSYDRYLLPCFHIYDTY